MSLPDFPGCITAGGQSREPKAWRAKHCTGIEEMRAAGEAAPEPSSFEAVMSDPDFSDGVAFVVSVAPVRSEPEPQPDPVFAKSLNKPTPKRVAPNGKSPPGERHWGDEADTRSTSTR